MPRTRRTRSASRARGKIEDEGTAGADPAADQEEDAAKEPAPPTRAPAPRRSARRAKIDAENKAVLDAVAKVEEKEAAKKGSAQPGAKKKKAGAKPETSNKQRSAAKKADDAGGDDKKAKPKGKASSTTSKDTKQAAKKGKVADDTKVGEGGADSDTTNTKAKATTKKAKKAAPKRKSPRSASKEADVNPDDKGKKGTTKVSPATASSEGPDAEQTNESVAEKSSASSQAETPEKGSSSSAKEAPAPAPAPAPAAPKTKVRRGKRERQSPLATPAPQSKTEPPAEENRRGKRRRSTGGSSTTSNAKQNDPPTIASSEKATAPVLDAQAKAPPSQVDERTKGVQHQAPQVQEQDELATAAMMLALAAGFSGATSSAPPTTSAANNPNAEADDDTSGLPTKHSSKSVAQQSTKDSVDNSTSNKSSVQSSLEGTAGAHAKDRVDTTERPQSSATVDTAGAIEKAEVAAILTGLLPEIATPPTSIQAQSKPKSDSKYQKTRTDLQSKPMDVTHNPTKDSDSKVQSKKDLPSKTATTSTAPKDKSLPSKSADATQILGKATNSTPLSSKTAAIHKSSSVDARDEGHSSKSEPDGPKISGEDANRSVKAPSKLEAQATVPSKSKEDAPEPVNVPSKLKADVPKISVEDTNSAPFPSKLVNIASKSESGASVKSGNDEASDPLPSKSANVPPGSNSGASKISGNVTSSDPLPSKSVAETPESATVPSKSVADAPKSPGKDTPNDPLPSNSANSANVSSKLEADAVDTKSVPHPSTSVNAPSESEPDGPKISGEDANKHVNAPSKLKLHATIPSKSREDAPEPANVPSKLKADAPKISVEDTNSAPLPSKLVNTPSRSESGAAVKAGKDTTSDPLPSKSTDSPSGPVPDARKSKADAPNSGEDTNTVPLSSRSVAAPSVSEPDSQKDSGKDLTGASIAPKVANAQSKSGPDSPKSVPSKSEPGAPKPVPSRSELDTPKLVPSTSEPDAPEPVPSKSEPDAPKPVPSKSEPDAPKPVPSKSEPDAPKPVPSKSEPDAPKPVPSKSEPDAPKPVSSKSEPDTPKPVPSRSELDTPKSVPLDPEADAQKTSGKDSTGAAHPSKLANALSKPEALAPQNSGKDTNSPPLPSKSGNTPSKSEAHASLPYVSKLNAPKNLGQDTNPTPLPSKSFSVKTEPEAPAAMTSKSETLPQTAVTLPSSQDTKPKSTTERKAAATLPSEKGTETAPKQDASLSFMTGDGPNSSLPVAEDSTSKQAPLESVQLGLRKIDQKATKAMQGKSVREGISKHPSSESTEKKREKKELQGFTNERPLPTDGIPNQTSETNKAPKTTETSPNPDRRSTTRPAEDVFRPTNILPNSQGDAPMDRAAKQPALQPIPKQPTAEQSPLEPVPKQPTADGAVSQVESAMDQNNQVEVESISGPDQKPVVIQNQSQKTPDRHAEQKKVNVPSADGAKDNTKTSKQGQSDTKTPASLPPIRQSKGIAVHSVPAKDSVEISDGKQKTSEGSEPQEGEGIRHQTESAVPTTIQDRNAQSMGTTGAVSKETGKLISDPPSPDKDSGEQISLKPGQAQVTDVAVFSGGDHQQGLVRDSKPSSTNTLAGNKKAQVTPTPKLAGTATATIANQCLTSASGSSERGSIHPWKETEQKGVAPNKERFISKKTDKGDLQGQEGNAHSVRAREPSVTLAKDDPETLGNKKLAEDGCGDTIPATGKSTPTNTHNTLPHKEKDDPKTSLQDKPPVLTSKSGVPSDTTKKEHGGKESVGRVDPQPREPHATGVETKDSTVSSVKDKHGVEAKDSTVSSVKDEHGVEAKDSTMGDVEDKKANEDSSEIPKQSQRPTRKEDPSYHPTPEGKLNERPIGIGESGRDLVAGPSIIDMPAVSSAAAIKPGSLTFTKESKETTSSQIMDSYAKPSVDPDAKNEDDKQQSIVEKDGTDRTSISRPISAKGSENDTPEVSSERKGAGTTIPGPIEERSKVSPIPQAGGDLVHKEKISTTNIVEVQEESQKTAAKTPPSNPIPVEEASVQRTTKENKEGKVEKLAGQQVSLPNREHSDMTRDKKTARQSDEKGEKTETKRPSAENTSKQSKPQGQSQSTMVEDPAPDGIGEETKRKDSAGQKRRVDGYNHEGTKAKRPKLMLSGSIQDESSFLEFEEIKLQLYSEGAAVHGQDLYDRKFVDYWDALRVRFHSPDRPAEIAASRSQISEFLKTKTMRKLHNKMIKALLRRSLLTKVPYDRISEFVPQTWKKRIKICPKPDPLSAAIPTLNLEKEKPKATLMDKLGYLPAIGGAAARPFHHKDKSNAEIRIPGALKIDPEVKFLAEASNLKVTDSAIWIIVSSAKEYATRVLKGCISVKRAVQNGKLKRPGPNPTVAVRPEKKARKDSGSGDLSRHLTSIDVQSFISTLPMGSKHRGGTPSRVAYERASMASHERSLPPFGPSFYQVKDFIWEKLAPSYSIPVRFEKSTHPETLGAAEVSGQAKTTSAALSRQSKSTAAPSRQPKTSTTVRQPTSSAAASRQSTAQSVGVAKQSQQTKPSPVGVTVRRQSTTQSVGVAKQSQQTSAVGVGRGPCQASASRATLAPQQAKAFAGAALEAAGSRQPKTPAIRQTATTTATTSLAGSRQSTTQPVGVAKQTQQTKALPVGVTVRRQSTTQSVGVAKHTQQPSAVSGQPATLRAPAASQQSAAPGVAGGPGPPSTLRAPVASQQSTAPVRVTVGAGQPSALQASQQSTAPGVAAGSGQPAAIRGPVPSQQSTASVRVTVGTGQPSALRASQQSTAPGVAAGSGQPAAIRAPVAPGAPLQSAAAVRVSVGPGQPLAHRVSQQSTAPGVAAGSGQPAAIRGPVASQQAKPPPLGVTVPSQQTKALVAGVSPGQKNNSSITGTNERPQRTQPAPSGTNEPPRQAAQAGGLGRGAKDLAAMLMRSSTSGMDTSESGKHSVSSRNSKTQQETTAGTLETGGDESKKTETPATSGQMGQSRGKGLGGKDLATMIQNKRTESDDGPSESQKPGG